MVRSSFLDGYATSYTTSTMWILTVKIIVAIINASAAAITLYRPFGATISTIPSDTSVHLYECVAPGKDISLQRGRFCARSLASRVPRSSEGGSSWMFFVQVVRGRPGGRLQFSGRGSKMAWLAFSSIRARFPK